MIILLIRRLVYFFIDTFIKLTGLNSGSKFASHFLERIKPVYVVKSDKKKYLFHCPNPLLYWRASTFFTKEPETIEWINNFDQNDILFDIGANIGLYSIYAGKNNITVFAFEPNAQNYSELNLNIILNQADDKVQAFCIALSDTCRVDKLYISETQPGAAYNMFGEKGKLAAQFKQGAISWSLDQFLSYFPDNFPNHIKIDVDGLESKIIQGSHQTLQDPRLKSILIELGNNPEEDEEILITLKKFGFHDIQSRNTLTGNHIFKRTDK